MSGRSHSYVMHSGSVKCNNCKININILCQMSRFVFKISLVLSSVTIIRSHTWAYFADTFVPFFGFHCNFRHCNFSYCSTRALSMLLEPARIVIRCLIAFAIIIASDCITQCARAPPKCPNAIKGNRRRNEQIQFGRRHDDNELGSCVERALVWRPQRNE